MTGSDLVSIIDDMRRLVVAESKTGELDGIDACAAVLADVGTAVLGTEPRIRRTDAGPVVQWVFGPGPYRLVLAGHYDTVHPAGSLADNPFRIDGDTIHGPGTFDMKAGIVTMLHAARAVLETGPERLDGVVIHCCPDEEIGSPASQAILREAVDQGLRAALVYEGAGTGGTVYESRLGGLWADITFTGRDAHASRPHEGANALHALVAFTQRMLTLAAPGLGTTVTATQARAGTAINTAPGRAVLTVDCRTVTVAEQDRVLAGLLAMASEVRAVTAEVVVTQRVPPFEAARSADLLATMRRALAAADVPWPGTSRGLGISDGNHLAGMGVCVVDGMGPAGGQDHSPEEWLDASSILPRIRMSAALIEAILKDFS